MSDENTCMLPLPIELREKIYGPFVQQHTLDERFKMYAMNDFISMMINGMDLDLDVKIQLALCWHRGSKLERPIQTTSR